MTDADLTELAGAATLGELFLMAVAMVKRHRRPGLPVLFPHQIALEDLAPLPIDTSATVRRLKPMPPLSAASLFDMPIAGGAINSPFGMRDHPILGGRRPHAGIDITAREGTPVLAAGPGKVSFAGPRGTFGNLVIVDHGGGFTTYYAHLSAIQVRTGDTVEKDEVIAAVGHTGRATGPHLHFEVRRNGVPVNPAG